MTSAVWREVLLPAEVDRDACSHLLQHYQRGEIQEDLCFGLWTPSTGLHRQTAIVTDVIVPSPAERGLHGNTSFEGAYLARATRAAMAKGKGLVFMHSHPSSGWQDMSEPDVHAERDRIVDTARATGKPLVGMTVGTDGHWSARFWEYAKGSRTCQWCRKVRVLHKTRLAVWRRPDDNQRDRRRQRRTVDSWGERKQRDLEALRIGVVGVGSVGSVVAEGLARVGVSEIVLIDHDVVEEHNLDRLLNAHRKDIGRLKTDVAENAIRAASTADGVVVANYPRKVQHRESYAAARDCDILVSCVDSPVARDLLNRIAHRDGVLVVDGGVDVRKAPGTESMNAARWKAHVAGPYTECLRCKRQYTSSDIMLELDGSWNNPNYIKGSGASALRSENVFGLSLATGSELLNMALRVVVADAWWPAQSGLERNFVTGRTTAHDGACHEGCSVKDECWTGDGATPIAYIEDEPGTEPTWFHRWLSRFTRFWR